MTRILPALFLAGLSLPALADPVQLTFENLPDSTQVQDSYAGFHFSDDVWSVRDLAPNGDIRFYGGAPGSEHSVVTLVGDDASTGALMMRVGVDAGFGTSFSVSIGALAGTSIEIQAFDADGHLLNGVNAGGFNGTDACLKSAICNWRTLTLDLGNSVKAAYVELSAPEGSAWFDDMSFGALPTAGPGNDVPEPSGAWLGLAALAALALSRRLSRR